MSAVFQQHIGEVHVLKHYFKAAQVGGWWARKASEVNGRFRDASFPKRSAAFGRSATTVADRANERHSTPGFAYLQAAVGHNC
jgi:hypothetical protein